MPFKLFSSIPAAIVACLLVCSAGCVKKIAPEKTAEMGAPVVAGPLEYTAIDTQWKESLDGGSGQRLPAARFLLVQMSIRNSGAGEAGVPMMQVIDANGKSYQELSNGEGVPQWLGFLRVLKPGETLHGAALFDAPPGAYKLRVSSGGDAEHETTALIELPLRVEAPQIEGPNPMAAPPLPTPK
jgi:hypothetical protein